jgi:hypothetical protein
MAALGDGAVLPLLAVPLRLRCVVAIGSPCVERHGWLGERPSSAAAAPERVECTSLCSEEMR